MKNLPLANRKPELQLFVKMLAGQTPTRILLVEAASGVGKTDLLAQFRRECHPHHYVVMVDLKAAERGIAYFFWRVREDLGHAHFVLFAQAMHQIIYGNVNIANNWTFGKSEIDIALAGDEKTRGFLITLCTRRFFKTCEQ